MTTQALYTNVLQSQVQLYQDTVYLTGRFADTAPLENDLSTQAANTLMAIEQLLNDAGSDKTRLLSATIYLKDVDADLETMDRIWNQWLPEGVIPIRAAMDVEQLAPDVLVEIAMTATL